MANVLDELRAEKERGPGVPAPQPAPAENASPAPDQRPTNVLQQLRFESGMERARRTPAQPSGELAEPRLQLRTAGGGESERGFGERAIQTVNDMLAGMTAQIEAAGQRTSPVVRNLEGEFLRPVVGEQVSTADYFRRTGTALEGENVVLDPQGEPVAFDPQTMVALDDPQSGKRLVFERTEETTEGILPALGRFIGVGAVTMPPVASSVVGSRMARVASRVVPLQEKAKALEKAGKTKELAKVQRKIDKLTDAGEPTAAEQLSDFGRVDVDPSLPALKTKQFGAPARTAEAVPFVGEPVKKGMNRMTQQLAAAAERVAAGFGQARTAEQAGERAQRGLERFIHSPVDEGAVGRYTDAVIGMPGAKTSFTTKAAALYRRAGRLIARAEKANPESTNVTLERSTKAARRALGKFDDPELAEIYQNNRLGKIFRSVQPPKVKDPQTGQLVDGPPKQLSWEDARQLRTEIRKLKNDEILLKDIDEASLDAIYDALTADLHAVAAKVGPAALKAIRRADRYTAAAAERIKTSLAKVTRAKSPEAAYRVITRALQEEGGNLRLVNDLKRSLKPEEWNDVAATVIHNLGKPTAGTTDVLDAVDFSPSRFVTNYSKLSDEAKTALFSGPGLEELKSSLDSLVRVTGAAKRLEKAGNPSRSGVFGIQAATFGGIGASASAGLEGIFSAAMGLVSGRTATQLMMSPKFVRWVTKGLTIKNVDAAVGHLSRLRALAGGPDAARLTAGAGAANIAGAGEELAKRRAGAVPEPALAEFADKLNFVLQQEARLEGTGAELNPDLRVRSRSGELAEEERDRNRGE